jgi:ubiquitin-protein ligase
VLCALCANATEITGFLIVEYSIELIIFQFHPKDRLIVMGYEIASSDSSPSSFATKCILWQYDELMRSPIKGVNASPLEHDILVWHGNFYFPDDHEWFPGMVIHFILTLPPNFPNAAPNMELLTSFPHSHVFGSSICFSLLQEFAWFFEEMPGTTHWNPSRTIRSLLESVYVFLTVDEDQHRKIDQSQANLAIQQSHTTCCHGCFHNPKSGTVWPLEEHWMASRTGASSDAAAVENQVCALAMYDDLTTLEKKNKAPSKPVSITSKLPAKAVVADINSTTKVRIPRTDASFVFELRSAVLKAEADERVTLTALSSADDHRAPTLLDQGTMEDFRCSITGVRFDHSDKVVLGFGVDVQRRPDGSIVSITTDLEPISMEIFIMGCIRKSALGAPMTHFFPFGIYEEHWKRTKLVLRGCVDAILGQGPDSRNLKTDEERLLFVVGELWKSMAVLMMKGETHTSEKVLKGFCSLHHLLLLATEEPDLVLKDGNARNWETGTSNGSVAVETKMGKDAGEPWAQVARRKPRIIQMTQPEPRKSLNTIASRQVRAFVAHPANRTKSKVPDFGRFLPLILLSDLSWQEMQAAVVEEVLTRNARWIVRAHTSLGLIKEGERRQLSGRMGKSWDASSTGLKLTAFQIRFFVNVLPWAHSALPAKLLAAYERRPKSLLLIARAMYNSLGGRPTPEMLERFQNEAKQIESLTNFPAFFNMINMPRGDMDIQIMLCNAMANSSRAGYHR